jgi:predicted Zn finger-like uncharacterized protein
MAIPIQCPHCQRAYKLKDELAGKRVTCTTCHKVFPVPAATVAASAPAGKPPPDAESLAVAALSDHPAVQQKAEGAPAGPVSIKVKCPFCDFENVFEGRFAGKNSPCKNDECRKIIKVPVLEKVEAKDWRTVKAKPTLAKVEADQMEGAWGNVEKVAVSREALKEAEAVGVAEEEDETPAWRKWLVRGLVGLGLVGVLAAATLWTLRKRSEGKQEHALDMAMEYTDLNQKKRSDKLSKEASALICVLAAQHEVRSNSGKAKVAWEHLLAARGRLDASTPERQAALIEILSVMTELPGTPPEVEKGQRLDWLKGNVQKEARSTLQKLEPVAGEDGRDMRAYAYRTLTRKLIARDLPDAPRVLVNSGPATERSEMLSVVGLEMISLGKRDEAEKIATQASIAGTENAPSLIALWLAIGSPDAPEEKRRLGDEKARAIAPPPSKETSLTPVARIGYAEGYARRGRVDEARKIAWANGKPEERLRAGVAVAAVVAESNPGDTADLEACAQLVEKEFKDRKAPPWLLMRLVQVSARAGKAELAQRFAATIGDAGLRAWGQYEALKARLKAAEAQKQKADDAWAREVGDASKLAHSLAWMAVARHNARVTGADNAMREVSRLWDKEPLKPFGYAGIALAGVADE